MKFSKVHIIASIVVFITVTATGVWRNSQKTTTTLSLPQLPTINENHLDYNIINNRELFENETLLPSGNQQPSELVPPAGSSELKLPNTKPSEFTVPPTGPRSKLISSPSEFTVLPTGPSELTAPPAKPSAEPSVVSVNKEKYPQISTRYPVSIDQLWTRIANNAHARRLAFFDNRKSSFNSPVILVSAFYDPRIDTKKHPMYARAVYKNDEEICSKSPGKWVQLRFGQPKTEVVKAYLLIFDLHTKEVPKALLLSEHSDCSSPSSYISVFYEKEDPAKPKLDFIVCLHQPLYSMYNPETLAAWFEMNRALGAQKIFVYYQEDIDHVNHIVQKYVDEGFVEVFGWYSNVTTKYDNCHGQILLMLDCLYRNMFTTKYLIFHDLDELIIPQKDPTWHGMMKTLDNPTKHISQFRFCFVYLHDAQAVMPMDDINDLRGCSALTDIPVIFKRTKRSEIVDCRTSKWKHIVKPTGIKWVEVHGATRAKGYSRLMVPTNTGVMYHARINDFKKGQQKAVEDFILYKYIKDVMTNLVLKFCPAEQYLE